MHSAVPAPRAPRHGGLLQRLPHWRSVAGEGGRAQRSRPVHYGQQGTESFRSARRPSRDEPV